MSSDKILNLLLQKYSEDLCVPECKTGSSWGITTGAVRLLDLWVMKKSWAKPWTIGYEIKHSRSDFLHDNKWSEYLDYCTDFYFVAPPGVIQPEELPGQVGLLVTSKNHTRLYTKRKAVHRDIEVPESIYRYILMWRVKIIKGEVGQSKQAYWQNWLAERDEKKQLGWNVSKKIKEIVKQRIDKVGSENARLRDENEDLTEIKNLVKELGFKTSYFSTYQTKDKLRAKVKEIEIT
ncbi:MmcB family DNA repair protein [Candidatus Pacearchaeota archaeon]|nr:MmcB family DNA repair protein [Candidatus Pacearchaeota archaeon]